MPLGALFKVASVAHKASKVARVAHKASKVASVAHKASKVATLASKTKKIASLSKLASIGSKTKKIANVASKGSRITTIGSKLSSLGSFGSKVSRVTDIASGLSSMIPSKGGPGVSDQSNYGNIASAGMGALDMITKTASEETNKVQEKAKSAAEAVASGLAAVTSGTPLITVSGTTSGPVKKHEKKLCPCNSNINKYTLVQEELPEGLREIIAQYFKVASRCKCKTENEELENYLLKKILNSKHELMRDGNPFGRTKLYKHIYKESTGVMAGGYTHLASTRKKRSYLIHKQKQQSRRRTRKN